MRGWSLAGTLSVLLFTALPAAPATSAADLPVARAVYDRTVYGDFAVVGNTVTTCPREPGHYPAELCRDAQNRVGSGPSAQNNAYPMAWEDVDADPATYNSSSARLDIPAGARVAYARLTWAGDTGLPASVPCGRGPVRPPGKPARQAVSLRINDRGALVAPEEYTEDEIGSLAYTDHQFYSAHADVTAQFHGITGPSTVSLGNVWTPQGYDCFGGWTLTAVWAFDAPQPAAPARKQVTVYDTYARVLTSKPESQVRVPSIRSAGGLNRAGLSGFEGDWIVTGDRFVVNGHNAGGNDNFFVSAADGQLKPDHANNMSVDARTVDLANDVLPVGETTANVKFTSGFDAYLVSGLVLSSGRPELAVATAVAPAVAHPGDQVTQSVTVTNTGSAPAVDVAVHMDIGTGCDQHIPRLEPGRWAKATCARPAPGADVRPSAQATGKSLIGDQLSASASTALEVVRPGIAVTKSASPGTVLNGQNVGYTIEIRNTGDTPLSNVAVDDKQVNACDKPDAGTLAAGEKKAVQCSVSAGDEGFTNTVTVTGTDKTGKKVSADASAAFTVIHPRIEFSVRPSTRAARVGETVTFTVTVRNPTAIALGGVRVTGTPAECARDIGVLAPQQTVEYTCSIVMRGRLVTALTVTALPYIDGQLVETKVDTVNLTSTVVVSLVEPEAEPRQQQPPPPPSPAQEQAQPPRPPAPPAPPSPPAAPTPPPAPPVVKKTADSERMKNVPVAAFVAGLATLSTFVTVGAISATAARARK